jgi:hypothetical protein
MARRARIQDVHDLAAALPEVTCTDGRIYQVKGKSFVFFRTPRPDALDPETGERLTDVVVFWVDTLEEKEAMVADPATPYFTTPHFNGHHSVLLRGSRIAEIDRDELAEVVTDAWLARAPKRLAASFLDGTDG